MSEHLEGTFRGSAGGSIFWQAWLPEQVKGVVVLAHGLAEHSGRYAYVGERLNGAGYALYALDHQGHGRSGGTPANIERWSHVQADLGALLSDARKVHPGVPVFLMGHSLGGLIALDHVVLRGGAGLNGLVLSGALVDPDVGSALQRAAAGVLSALVPNLGVAALDATAVSRDPVVVKAYVDDPLNYHGKVRARTGAEMIQAVDHAIAGLGSVQLPVLAMHGTADRLTPPKGSSLVVEKAGSSDKTLKLYDGLFHEIFNEPERDLVLDDVVAWLDAHA